MGKERHGWENGEGYKFWQGPGVGRGRRGGLEMGSGATGGGDRNGGGNGEGETWMGKRGGAEVLARAGSGEGETGRVRLGEAMGRERGAMRIERWLDGKRKGETGKGAKGRGRRGKRRGDFTDGYDEMPGWTYGIAGWNEVTEFSLFARATPGTPASQY